MPSLQMSSGGGVLRSERVMAELSMANEWVRFRTLYRGRYLGELIMCYVGHTKITKQGRELVRCRRNPQKAWWSNVMS